MENKTKKDNIYSKATISVRTLDIIILCGIAVLIILVAASM